MIQTIQLMKGQRQQQFSAEKDIVKKALKSLVASKHEIRIHFLNSNTLHVQRKDADQHSSAKIAPAGHQDQQVQTPNPENQPVTTHHARLSHKEDQAAKPKEDLFEVVYRNANRMQSIGWHDEQQARRTSNMSRTFRRQRRSNLQDYSTLHDHHEHYDGENKSRVSKSGRLTINNLELSGFTNQGILQKSSRSIELAQPHKSSKQKVKQTHILTFIGQKNRLKMAQFMPPISEPAKGVFSIAINKLNKKWRFQAKPQGSQSAREMINADLYSTQFKQQIGSPPVSSECRREKGEEAKIVQPYHHENPFLKQIKPSPIGPIQKQKSESKRAHSQFIRSRTKYFQKYSPKKVQIVSEEGCRPWSVLRNMDDKIDEGKPSLDEPVNG